MESPLYLSILCHETLFFMYVVIDSWYYFFFFQNNLRRGWSHSDNCNHPSTNSSSNTSHKANISFNKMEKSHPQHYIIVDYCYYDYGITSCGETVSIRFPLEIWKFLWKLRELLRIENYSILIYLFISLPFKVFQLTIWFAHIQNSNNFVFSTIFSFQTDTLWV